MRSAKAYDIIGDVHGCWEELLDLIAALGYTYDHSTGVLVKPAGRNLVFVGDLVDRGPDSVKVLEIAMNLERQGCIFLYGNHCYELLLLLRGKHDLFCQLLGRKVPAAGVQLRTVEQICARGSEFVQEVIGFLARLQFSYEHDALVVVHAGYRQKSNGALLKRCALTGEYLDENGSLLYDGYTSLTGNKTVVHGHFAGTKPETIQLESGPRMINVDSGCCFGHQLTALRYPEMYYLAIPARQIYR